MPVIGISATFDHNLLRAFTSIYKAQHDGIVLCSHVRSADTFQNTGTNNNNLVRFIKRSPIGQNDIFDNLQGVFFGQGSELIIDAFSICKVEITIMSQSNLKDHQIIYPIDQQIIIQVQDFKIDDNICGSCQTGNRVLSINGKIGTQLTLKLLTQNNIEQNAKYPIKLYQWVGDPVCPPLNKEESVSPIAAFSRWIDQYILVLTSQTTLLSFAAPKLSEGENERLICLSNPQLLGDEITVTLNDFANEPQ